MADIIDIDVFQTVTSVSFEVEPNTNIININKVTIEGSGGGATNLSPSQTATNFTINSDTGTDATIPLGNGTLAGATLNDYTTAEKNKLSGIATGAEVNVNADWNATSGDAQILNKPTIPAASPITIVNGNSLFSTGLTGTGAGATDATRSNFLGNQAGAGATYASYSNFFGDSAGYDATDAADSNFFGDSAGKNGAYANNSNFFGYSAGENATNATRSNFFGENAGTSAIDANNSNFFGNAAGEDATGAAYSNFFGYAAGYEAINANNSNFFGNQTGRSFTDNNVGSNNIIIGTNISLPDATDNSINLGGVLFGTGTHSDLSGDPSITPISGGRIGIGVVSPTNTLHIYSEADNTSGLRLERLTSASPSSTGKLIGVDSSGNVVTLEGAGGGGSSVNYYLNGGTSQGTFGGTTYYEFSKTAVIGTEADFTISSNGYIASFITDVADPSLLLIPAGNWNLEFFFSSSSAGGSPSFYAELYKYDGTTFTLIASGSAVPEGITNGTSIDAYFTALAVPETILTVNDRLAIRVYVNASSKTITLHTQNGHLCEVITTFSAGLTALNGLQAQVQNFAVGTTGTDFAINSSGSTHTFNLPSASLAARGVVTTGDQTFAGSKTFTGTINATSENDYAISAISTNSDGLSAESTNGIGVFGGSVNAAGGVFMTTNNANIAEFKTNLVTKATVSANGTFAGTGLNASGQTINTIASFDASKNVVSLSTATYPSLTELALLKGVSGSSVQTQLDGKVTGNTAITGATKTKITYDSKGLVTAGADATTADIADSTNKRYVTDANLVVIGNTSGTNTGDNATNTQYSGLAASKQDTLQSTVNIKSINGNSLLGSGDLVISGGGSTPQSAFTILANNTNASAVPTEQVFKEVAEQVYTPTPVWTATTAPTGTTNHTYQWSQIGKTVNVRLNLIYTSVGIGATIVICPFPTDLPIPISPSGLTTASANLYYGSGLMTNTNSSQPVTLPTFTSIRRNAANTGYEFIMSRASNAPAFVYISIQYFTA